MIHKLLELIATSSLLTWITIKIIAPLDRRLLLITNGRLSLTGSSTVLLITTGARSGELRYSSLPGLYFEEEAEGGNQTKNVKSKIILLASKGGAPTHPAWYHNLVKSPEVEILSKGQRLAYHAEVAKNDQRAKLWLWLLEQWAGFLAYEKKAAPRILPIVVLTPK